MACEKLLVCTLIALRLLPQYCQLRMQSWGTRTKTSVMCMINVERSFCSQVYWKTADSAVAGYDYVRLGTRLGKSTESELVPNCRQLVKISTVCVARLGYLKTLFRLPPALVLCFSYAICCKYVRRETSRYAGSPRAS